MALLRLSHLRFVLLLACSLACCTNGFNLLYGATPFMRQFLVEESTGDQEARRFDPQLSYLSLVASAAAYATRAASDCYGNSGLSSSYGPMKNVTQVVVPASRYSIAGTWSGFVARLPSKRITLVVYRGTYEDRELLIELLSVLRLPPVSSPIGGRTQAYFHHAERAVWSRLESAFYRLRSAHPFDTVLVTGHSLGGAMAALTAAELASSGTRLQLFTFGEPRVGDARFAAALDKVMARSNSWRVVNGRDPVVHLPLCKGPLERCHPSAESAPFHHGTEVFYPAGMRPNSPSGFRVCHGGPKNEDQQCADSPNVFLPCLSRMASCIDAHLHYYGIKVSKWWQNSHCQPVREPDQQNVLQNLVMESLLNDRMTD